MAERNPKAGTFRTPEGYRDLGWQLPYDAPELAACREAGHKCRTFDNSLYLCRCSDKIIICDECRHVHHQDMT